jgi:hypothetical protein
MNGVRGLTLSYSVSCRLCLSKLWLMAMLVQSDRHFLLQKLGPLLLSPATRDLVGHKAIPQHGGRHMDAILARELDYSIFSTLHPGL